jgi:hypothetical protein
VNGSQYPRKELLSLLLKRVKAIWTTKMGMLQNIAQLPIMVMVAFLIMRAVTPSFLIIKCLERVMFGVSQSGIILTKVQMRGIAKINMKMAKGVGIGVTKDCIW